MTFSEVTMYEVIRHSGHTRSTWRVLFKTTNLYRAEVRFKLVVSKIRRGTVQLRKDDEIIAIKWAPHLRLRSKSSFPKRRFFDQLL
jgi:hypothetical protein